MTDAIQGVDECILQEHDNEDRNERRKVESQPVGRHKLPQRTQDRLCSALQKLHDRIIRIRVHLVGRRCAISVCVQLDAEELAADEDVVSVGELAVRLEADVGAVPAAEIREEEVPFFVLDGAVLRGHEDVAGEV